MSAIETTADDFEVAKAVFEKLKDLTRERQERVLRWVCEGLGISPAPPAHPAQPTATPEAPTHEIPPANQGHALEETTDIKTFINNKSPTSDMQFAAAVAYYYRFIAPPAKRLDHIDTEVLQEATRLVARERLANPRATLNNAKAQGYLDSAGTGTFSINTVGENLIAMALPASAEKSPKKRGRPPQSARQPSPKKRKA